MIDADYFRAQFPEYNGKNSSVFQKASSWLVEQSLKYVLEHGYSFILEDTFAILSAEKILFEPLKITFALRFSMFTKIPKLPGISLENVN